MASQASKTRKICERCTNSHALWQHTSLVHAASLAESCFHQQGCPHTAECAECQCAALVLQVGQSGWTRPLPLENGGVGSDAEDFNTQPVLIRAKIPEWGTVHEVVARTELVGRGFERTLVGLWGGCRLCCFLVLALAAGSFAAEPELAGADAEVCL